MIRKPNFILIGSAGRNSGKTEFACRLIEKCATSHIVYGVKVSAYDNDPGECPRRGPGCGNCTTLKEDYEILEASVGNPGKDSTRMLMAGARKSLFLRVRTHALEKGVRALLKIIPEEAVVVCESNSLRKVLEPGLFLIIRNAEEKEVKESFTEVVHWADKIIISKDLQWDFSPDRIFIADQTWFCREEATAIILAGGKSTRMGTDKSLLPVKGVPLVAYIARQLEDHFDEVVIGAGDPGKFSFLGYRVIPDTEGDKGPLMGILTCLSASRSELNFITACDIPEMNLRFIHSMIHMAVDADIVIPVSANNKYEPLYAVYRKPVAFEAKRILDGNQRRVTALLERVRVKLTGLDDTGWYRNLNFREDYQDYLRGERTKSSFSEE